MQKTSRFIAFILLAYILVVAVGVESINSSEEGGILQNWHEGQREIATGGGGSGLGKMRSHGEFQVLLFVFGVWVYPFSVIAACIFVRQAFAAKNKVDKGVLFSCSILCLAIVARFISLGVLAGAGIG